MDPHPGPLIQDTLQPHLPQLEYREWAHSGHYPWLERSGRDEFFAVLNSWLAQQGALGSEPPNDEMQEATWQGRRDKRGKIPPG